MRVLLVGAYQSNNLEAFASDAFARRGHQVRFLGYSEFLPVSPAMWAKTATRIWGPLFNLGANVVLRRFQLAIVDAVTRFDPDLMLVFKGEGVAPSTVSHLRNHSSTHIALWFPDDPRFFTTFVRWVAPAYDTVFTYSMRGLGRYQSIGVARTFCVPFGCDPSVHRIFPDVVPGRGGPDIAFVGTYTPRRARFLKNLEREGFRIEVYGPLWTQISSKSSYHPAIYGEGMSRLCSKAKITLNIHNTPGWGPNMRVFEATGSGGCLITDDCEDLGLYYDRGRELEVFRDSRDLGSKIRYYLENEAARDEMAKLGNLRAQKHHTYDVRIGEIIKRAVREGETHVT